MASSFLNKVSFVNKATFQPHDYLTPADKIKAISITRWQSGNCMKLESTEFPVMHVRDGNTAPVTVVQISDIMKSTSDDDKPIPGYLYNDISNITLESSESCESCREFLVDRLAGDSTHVKLKVLKLMKYIVQHGNPDFKLGLMKTSKGVKEATKYSGAPDPLHGNVPYQMVRQAATELNEILFQSDVHQAAANVPKISTVGIGHTVSKSSNSSGRMEGFGNVMPKNKSVGESLKEGLMRLADTLGETTLDHQRVLLSALDGSTGSYKPPVDNTAVTVTSPVDPVQHSQTAGHSQQRVRTPKHVPGRAGGGWEDSEEEEEEEHVPVEPGSLHLPTASAGSGSVGTGDGLDALTDDVTEEQSVVTRYLEGCDRLSPSQLNLFVKDCSCLNCDTVLHIINHNLTSKSQDTLMRSLLQLEWLMTSDLVTLDRLSSVCRSSLTSIYSSHTGPTQAKARKLIRILEKLTCTQGLLPVIQNSSNQNPIM